MFKHSRKHIFFHRYLQSTLMKKEQLLQFPFLLLSLIFSQLSLAQVFPSESPLKEGAILKIEIKTEGVYKITGAALSSAGVSLNTITPNKLQLFGNTGGMLPQGNNVERPGGLKEIAVQIEGVEDGNFGANDFILFYAEGADKIYYDTDLAAWRKATNLYAESNFYFLKVGNDEGKRIENQTALGTITNTQNSFTDLVHHEIEQTSILNSGRKWYGEVFNFDNLQTFDFDAAGALPNTEMKLIYSVMAQASVASQMKFMLNDSEIGKVDFNSIPQTTYGLKGNNQFGVFQFQSSTNNNQELQIQYEQPNSNAKAYLDYYTINFNRTLAKYQPQQFFRFVNSNPVATQFRVENMGVNDHIWEVSSFYTPQKIAYNNSSQSFNGLDNGIYIIFNPEDALSPVAISSIENQNLHALDAAEFLIITPKEFKTEAERLANFRIENDQIESRVIEVRQIYNEFSSGRQDITAIRDFIRSIYLKDPTQLKYILLFADGSFDYKNRIPNNNNFIPIYESYESLHPIYSHSSDDFFGFMDEDEGEWAESFSSNDHSLELGVGRFPISTPEEAKVVVDKLVRYSASPNALGKWRNRVVMVADDGDFNVHQLQANQLGEFIEENHGELNVERLFVDAFPQETTPFGKKSFEVKNRIDQLVESGSLIINYSGHGAETGWASEGILDNPQILNWSNRNKMPLLVTATCEFGRYDDPNKKSGAEYAVLHKDGGAIGLLTTTRPVFSNTNFTVNKAFYEAAFTPINGSQPRLGDIIRITKNNSISGVINRNFTLLGDPSMSLASATEKAVITAINGAEISDISPTINALEKVNIKGEIQSENTLSQDFEGILEVVIFDKMATIRTLGDEGPNTAMEFQSRERILYQGQVSVQNGLFEINFVVPKNIDYSLGEAKISLYASHNTALRDAGGYYKNLIVGGSNPAIVPDENAPLMASYLQDRSFVDGGLVTPNTQLLIDLEDEQGINVLGNGIEHDLTATLDNSQVFFLNNFFEGALDDFTKGTVKFPLENLTPGPHQIKIQAWDTHNNATEQSLHFIVSDSEAFTITEAYAYPNPSNGEGITFGFSHNKPGAPLQVTLSVYSTDGKRVVYQKNTYESSPSFISFLKWQTQVQQLEQTTASVYPFYFTVRYLTTGEEKTQQGKVFINR